MMTPFPWMDFSKKACDKISKLRSCGVFPDQSVEGREIRKVGGKEGIASLGNALSFSFLVDETDGVIVDAKYQLFGHAALIAVAEALCELVVSKNYDQAGRISAELIDKQLRDIPNRQALPPSCAPYMDMALSALQEALQKCTDLPLAQTYTSPVPTENNNSEGYPGWGGLPKEQRLAVIEKVIDEEIRPYIELDEGGVELLDLVKDHEVIIAYKGACTSCFSAIGATLSTIQEILQSKVDRTLVVVPNTDDLSFL